MYKITFTEKDFSLKHFGLKLMRHFWPRKNWFPNVKSVWPAFPETLGIDLQRLHFVIGKSNFVLFLQ